MANEKVMLLIDADNVSVDVMQQAVRLLLQQHGALHVRRAYCTAESAVKHQAVFKHLGIRAMVNLATGKNSTDIALAVDAMVLVWTERPDVVVIASSDSDFAPLVQSLRERGCVVRGIGQSGKTGDETQDVYDDFTVLEHRKTAPAPARSGRGGGRSNNNGGGRSGQESVGGSRGRSSAATVVAVAAPVEAATQPAPEAATAVATAATSTTAPAAPVASDVASAVAAEDLPRGQATEPTDGQAQTAEADPVKAAPRKPRARKTAPQPVVTPAAKSAAKTPSKAAEQDKATTKGKAQATVSAAAKKTARKTAKPKAAKPAEASVSDVAPVQITAPPTAPTPSPLAPTPVKAGASAAPRPAAAQTATRPLPTADAVLGCLPELKAGRSMALNVAVQRLREAQLLGKNTSSAKLFGHLSQRFELVPAVNPSQVRLRG